MARDGLVIVVGLVGVALLSESLATAGSRSNPATSSPGAPPPIVAPRAAGASGSAAQQIAEQQARPLSDQQLADRQAAAKAYVAEMAKDPGTIVCLTSQETIGLIISVDRPVDAQPFTAEDKQRSCQVHLTGSHAAT